MMQAFELQHAKITKPVFITMPINSILLNTGGLCHLTEFQSIGCYLKHIRSTLEVSHKAAYSWMILSVFKETTTPHETRYFSQI